ncbi:uncharacterized protein A4U43_C05F640 [Asparagus officinalis]|uniref:NAD(P)H dehydrogenase (quinone) n=1 Tax=Asparagus officinalis TaxID=4686 RepID=A0A5P1ENB4_ASPOF|nr:NADPH:quinone oxidoreductase-like [Asparagus officinalis]XP_020268526.1 NADPH:quinone oxidoreductase-like [Asparagus officinalis]ONK67495.1 uncharacterized protein A4U43_C05F640 [Asparagus officinalis]
MEQTSSGELAIITYNADERAVDKEDPHRETPSQEPSVGMAFESHEEVYQFYKEYGKQKGFGVMIKHSNKRADGRCRRLVLSCCKGGKAPDEPSRPSAKTDCGAKIIAKLWADGLLHLIEVDNEHNHPVSPLHAHSVRYSEKLPNGGRKRRKHNHESGVNSVHLYPSVIVQGGGYENLVFGQKGREIMGGVVWGTKPIIKVAAICGSLRKGSFNRALLHSAIQLSKESIGGLQIEYVDISSLPFLNTDLEVNGRYPPPVEAFRQNIFEADSILFASPEYNYSLTGPLKNAIDWASRPPNFWANKPAAIISAGGNFGGGRSQYHLRQVGVYLDIHFINKPELFVKVYEPPAKFDSHGNLIDTETRERLKQVLLSLQSFTYKQQSRS